MARLLVVSMALLSVEALAQGSPEARARELFIQGQGLFKDGRFREAAVKFEEANLLSPRAGNYFNIARCYEEVGETAKALSAYRSYLRAAGAAADRAEVEAAVKRLEGQLKASGVQQVTVLVEPATARAMVTIDGRPVGAAPATVELPAGTHTLVVEALGYQPLERRFSLGLEKASDIKVAVLPAPALPDDAPVAKDPAPKDPPDTKVASGNAPATTLTPSSSTGTTPPAGGLTTEVRPRRPYVGAWITTGLTVAAVGTGVLMTVLASGQQATLRDGSLRTLQENQDLVQRGTTFQTVSFISYALAGALGITTGLLFAFEGR